MRPKMWKMPVFYRVTIPKIHFNLSGFKNWSGSKFTHHVHRNLQQIQADRSRHDFLQNFPDKLLHFGIQIDRKGILYTKQVTTSLYIEWIWLYFISFSCIFCWHIITHSVISQILRNKSLYVSKVSLKYQHSNAFSHLPNAI